MLAKVKLNAIRRPFSPQYDPKYRMRYKSPRLISGCAGKSTAASRQARYAYVAAMRRRHGDDVVLLKEIFDRQNVM